MFIVVKENFDDQASFSPLTLLFGLYYVYTQFSDTTKLTQKHTFDPSTPTEKHPLKHVLRLTMPHRYFWSDSKFDAQQLVHPIQWTCSIWGLASKCEWGDSVEIFGVHTLFFSGKGVDPPFFQRCRAFSCHLVAYLKIHEKIRVRDVLPHQSSWVQRSLLGLHLQLVVDSLQSHEFIVIALLHYTAICIHQNHVTAWHRGLVLIIPCCFMFN